MEKKYTSNSIYTNEKDILSFEANEILRKYEWDFLNFEPSIIGAYFEITERFYVINKIGIKILLERYPSITDVIAGYYVTQIINNEIVYDVCINIKEFGNSALFYLTKIGKLNLINTLNKQIKRITSCLEKKSYEIFNLNSIKNIKTQNLGSVLMLETNKIFYINLFVSENWEFKIVISNLKNFSAIRHFDRLNKNKDLSCDEYIYYFIDYSDNMLVLYNKINSFINHYNGNYGFYENNTWFNNNNISDILLEKINCNNNQVEILPNYQQSSKQSQINLFTGLEIYKAFTIAYFYNKPLIFNIIVSYNSKTDPFNILVTIKSENLPQLLKGYKETTFIKEFPSFNFASEFLEELFLNLNKKEILISKKIIS